VPAEKALRSRHRQRDPLWAGKEYLVSQSMIVDCCGGDRFVRACAGAGPWRRTVAVVPAAMQARARLNVVAARS
jgi:hypothetical protein